jgi:hypothetical protein
MDTNELHLTAASYSFSSNINLLGAEVFPLADGRYLVLQSDTTRAVIATPYPPEG